MANHIETGLCGEEAVVAYLESFGWEIVARRWRDRQPGGLRTDIDLVARSADGVWHFVEVKTRGEAAQSGGDFAPERALTAAKMARMTAAAERYMGQGRLSGELSLDLAAVVFGPGGAPVIRYYPNLSR